MKDNTSLYEYIRLFILSKGIEASVVCETDGQGETRLIAILTQLLLTTLCYLQDQLSTSSASRPELLYWRPGMSHRPLQAHSQWLQAGFDSGLHCRQLSQMEATQLEAAALSGVLSLTADWLLLWRSLHPTDSTAAGICIYYFIMPTDFRLDHMIFIHLFTQVHLWLTARSKVSMSQ